MCQWPQYCFESNLRGDWQALDLAFYWGVTECDLYKNFLSSGSCLFLVGFLPKFLTSAFPVALDWIQARKIPFLRSKLNAIKKAEVLTRTSEMQNWHCLRNLTCEVSTGPVQLKPSLISKMWKQIYLPSIYFQEEKPVWKWHQKL